MNPLVQAFFEPTTATISYIVYDRVGGHAAVIDPVLDFNAKSGRTATHSADRQLRFIEETGLSVDWILETHAHADHLSAAHYLKERCGGRIAIGEHIAQVQSIFKQLFNLETGFATDGSQFDHLFKDLDTFRIGELQGQALFVPGHTPADLAYRIGDAVFVGDTLFMPDVGSARCDFPGGDARTLFRSAQRLLSLPAATRLYMCHDYPPDGREPVWETTVAEQRRANIHLADGIDEATFVARRRQRDATLDVPALLLPAIQINIRAGQLPLVESNGVRYLKLPLDAF
jgi:glyoxylase-like metal-dependent hydrolase (beta-lactamase superfamily II)